MDTISFIISIVAILLSIYTYLVHDKKIKTQELKLNDYQLEKIKTEKEDGLKAKIESSLSKSIGMRTLTTINNGECPARNVRIDITSDDDSVAYIKRGPHPLLKKGETIEHHLHFAESHVNFITIKHVWSDDFGQDREDVQVLSI